MKKVSVILVLDETGSMQKIKDQTISSTNEYLSGLEPQGSACRVTLIKFNSHRETVVCDNVPVKDCPKLNQGSYHPDASTPLLDAVGHAIRRAEEQVARSKEGQDVLVVVVTDGEENDSHEYTVPAMSKLVTEKEKAGWTFVYLGANQDSWKSAQSLGYGNVGNVADFVATPDGVKSAMGRTLVATQSYFRDRATFYRLAALRHESPSTISFSATNFYGAEKPAQQTVSHYCGIGSVINKVKGVSNAKSSKKRI